jgi:hypothetical protein
LATERNHSKQRRVDTVTAHDNLTLANIREGSSRCISKPFKDGTDGIGRGLVAKNIDDGLELEASSRNIFAWEVTDMKVFDVVFDLGYKLPNA